jgi:hypothetical protein
MRLNPSMWMNWKIFGLASLLFIVAFAMGRATAPSVGREMNSLLSVGFKVFDPEGFEVSHWDE